MDHSWPLASLAVNTLTFSPSVNFLFARSRSIWALVENAAFTNSKFNPQETANKKTKSDLSVAIDSISALISTNAFKSFAISGQVQKQQGCTQKIQRSRINCKPIYNNSAAPPNNRPGSAKGDSTAFPEQVARNWGNLHHKGSKSQPPPIEAIPKTTRKQPARR